MLQVAGPPAPEDLRRDQKARRDRIVRAALRALASSDHEGVKISEVARDADVALGTLYRYFASKEHLFGAAFYEWQAALQAKLETSAPKGDTEQERLRDVFHRTVKAFQRQPQFFRVMMMLETTGDPYAAEIYSSLGSLFEATVGPAFAGPLEGDRAAVFRVLNSVLTTTLRSWVVGRGSINAVYDGIDEALRLMYDGGVDIRRAAPKPVRSAAKPAKAPVKAPVKSAAKAPVRRAR
jgi:AcrR family transcriptional regulator